jgi:hypothetical protein
MLSSIFDICPFTSLIDGVILEVILIMTEPKVKESKD